MRNKQIIVEVVDAPMSTGKTTGIIEWMKKHPNEKYLYVSPMLSEVEARIPQECEELSFVSPDNEDTTKGEKLLQLLNEGRNISFTHALFQSLSKEHLNTIERQQYVLIIDEEVGLIEPYKGRYTKGDIKFLLDGEHISIDYNNYGEISWIGGDVDTSASYASFKRMCDSRSLYITKGERDMLISQLPIRLVSSAKRTIILTYMFNGGVMESFLLLRGVAILPFKEINLMRCPKEVLKRAKNLISIEELPSTKKVARWSMSSSWYERVATKEQLKSVATAFWSVYRRYDKEKMLITLPKASSERYLNNSRKVNPKYALDNRIDSSSVFLYSAARATNDYSERDVLVHGYNRFINVPVKAYFDDYGDGITPSEDVFALSEMLQWIWRSAIRNDFPIKVYVLNGRMKMLLQEWINNID